MKKFLSILFGALVIIQTILHYLGLLGIGLGIIALAFKNIDRGKELLLSGIGMIALKYLLGFIFWLISLPLKK